MSLLKKNRERLETQPDVTDLLGDDDDGTSNDWYTESDTFEMDVRGEKTDRTFEEDHAPDFGTFFDADARATTRSPYIPMAPSTDDAE